MIRSFKSKPLAELWETGQTAKIDAKMHERILRRLDRLDAAAAPGEMNSLVLTSILYEASGPRGIRSTQMDRGASPSNSKTATPAASTSNSITEERR